MATQARLRPRGRPLRVGFFGRILPYKGIDLFVETIRAARARGIEVHGVVYGDGDAGGAMVAGADLDIEWHLGWLAEVAVNAAVATFDVLVLPYTEASQSGVLGVAMAEGVPVVVTPVGGLREQVAATGMGVVADAVSAEALAAALDRLCAPDGSYEAASTNAVAAAEGPFSWARVVEDVVRFAEVAIAHPRARGKVR